MRKLVFIVAGLLITSTAIASRLISSEKLATEVTKLLSSTYNVELITKHIVEPLLDDKVVVAVKGWSHIISFTRVGVDKGDIFDGAAELLPQQKCGGHMLALHDCQLVYREFSNTESSVEHGLFGQLNVGNKLHASQNIDIRHPIEYIEMLDKLEQYNKSGLSSLHMIVHMLQIMGVTNRIGITKTSKINKNITNKDLYTSRKNSDHIIDKSVKNMEKVVERFLSKNNDTPSKNELIELLSKLKKTVALEKLVHKYASIEMDKDRDVSRAQDIMEKGFFKFNIMYNTMVGGEAPIDGVTEYDYWSPILSEIQNFGGEFPYELMSDWGNENWSDELEHDVELNKEKFSVALDQFSAHHQNELYELSELLSEMKKLDPQETGMSVKAKERFSTLFSDLKKAANWREKALKVIDNNNAYAVETLLENYREIRSPLSTGGEMMSIIRGEYLSNLSALSYEQFNLIREAFLRYVNYIFIEHRPLDHESLVRFELSADHAMFLDSVGNISNILLADDKQLIEVFKEELHRLEYNEETSNIKNILEDNLRKAHGREKYKGWD